MGDRWWWGGHTDLDTTELHQHNDQSTQSRPKPEGSVRRRRVLGYKPQDAKAEVAKWSRSNVFLRRDERGETMGRWAGGGGWSHGILSGYKYKREMQQNRNKENKPTRTLPKVLETVRGVSLFFIFFAVHLNTFGLDIKIWRWLTFEPKHYLKGCHPSSIISFLMTD